MSALSHLDREGRARMVDVAAKPLTARTAVAAGAVRMSAEAFQLVADKMVSKGDVLAVAEIAGTMAAKRTAELIPLCHPLALDQITVEASLDEADLSPGKIRSRNTKPVMPSAMIAAIPTVKPSTTGTGT